MKDLEENKCAAIKAPVLLGNIEYSSAVLDRDLKVLQQAYPFISVEQIGKSILGKPIWQIKIGRGSRKIQFNASFHANEWITSGILMQLANEFLLSLTNQDNPFWTESVKVYNEVELSIIPMVNPDGVDLVVNGPPKGNKSWLTRVNNGSSDFSGWKANIRGVDLNNQFPAKWEIEKQRKEPQFPAPRDYPGERPLTEPEAYALAEAARKNNYDMVIALHSQGEEFYWGYDGMEPLCSRTIAEEFAKECGYRQVRTIDSHAGYKDWFIQEFRKPGFTIELGKGINPLPLSAFNSIFNDMLKLFRAALKIENFL